MSKYKCLHLLMKGDVCHCGYVRPLPDPAATTCNDTTLTTCGGTDQEKPATPPPAPAPAVPRDPAAENLRARAFRARRSFAWFVRESWHVLEPTTELEWGWHLQAICDHIQWILEDWRRAKRDKKFRQRVRNAVFNLPPGVLKTRLLVELAPAWMWLDSPEWSVTCLSVNPDRALDSADNSRRVITSEWYQAWFRPAWELREDQDAKSNFGNTRGGFRKSRGITAKIIGGRTDAILVDDPNSPDDDADACAKVNHFWDSTLYHRVNDLRLSVRIVVQQRVDADDLSGHIKRHPEDWMFFVLPLLFDPARRCETPFGWNDPRQEKDEPLHPARFTVVVIAKLREVYGPTMFESQCQQDPESGEGEVFKLGYWRFFRPSNADAVVKRPDGCSTEAAEVVPWDPIHKQLEVDHVVVTMDPTGGSENEDASHVGLLVCAVWGRKRLVLADLAPGPRGFFEQLSDLSRAIVLGAEVTGKRVVRVLVEKKALGAAVLAAIERHLRETGFQTKDGAQVAATMEDWNPGQDNKEKRGYAMEPTLALGDVLLPEGAPWIPAFLREFKRFPKKPNDRVDALAQFVARYGQKRTWADAYRAAGR